MRGFWIKRIFAFSERVFGLLSSIFVSSTCSLGRHIVCSVYTTVTAAKKELKGKFEYGLLEFRWMWKVSVGRSNSQFSSFAFASSSASLLHIKTKFNFKKVILSALKCKLF